MQKDLHSPLLLKQYLKFKTVFPVNTLDYNFVIIHFHIIYSFTNYLFDITSAS